LGEKGVLGAVGGTGKKPVAFIGGEGKESYPKACRNGGFTRRRGLEGKISSRKRALWIRGSYRFE